MGKKNIENLKNCQLNSNELVKYFGMLESKGLEVIGEYSKIIA